MKPGDVIYGQQENGKWPVIKILDIDVWDDQSEAFHCLSYNPVEKKPTINDRKSFEVMVWHSPIDGTEFRRSWKVLCSEEIKPEELRGFHYYLKLTDFPRYLTETGQDGEEIVNKANSFYQKALVFSEKGKIDEAIDNYSEAIELFPLFFEAIDNKAFLFMEKGDYERAIVEFEESLRVNPDGIHAFFSRGECFLKLKDYEEAEKVFLACIHKYPDQQADFLRFLEMAKVGKKVASKNIESKSDGNI